jgi:hypothetical protein
MKLNIVPARTGFVWVRLGIQVFFKQPLALTGLFFLFMATLSVLNLVPVLGSLASLVLLPSLGLGLMAAAQRASQGSFPMPSVLLTGLRGGQASTRPLMVLGLIYAFWFCMVLVLTSVADGGEFARMFFLHGPQDEAAGSASGMELPRGMFLFMLLHLPLSLAFWHAPALTHWHGITPVKSLFFSLVGCWRNKGAYVVFGLAWFAVVMAEGILVQILALLLNSPEVMVAGTYTVSLLTTCMFMCSVYFSFRDSFEADEVLEELPKP